MDFTEQFKKDILSGIPQEKSCKVPFLAGVTKNCAYVELYKKSVTLTYEFESKDEAVALLPLIREVSGGEVFFVQQGAQGQKSYKIQLKDSAADELAKKLHLSRFGENFVLDNGVEYLESLDKDTFFHYLRGVALVAAKLKFPDKQNANYSLRFTFADKQYAEAFRDKMLSLNLDMKLSESKTGYALLSRNSSDIEDILAMCKATNSVLVLNEVLVERDKENFFNRMSNFYMANYNKSVAGTKKYADAIKILQKNGTLDVLDKKLQIVARARLEKSDETMKELADRLKMSKTSLSRALNKLLAISEGKYDGRD